MTTALIILGLLCALVGLAGCILAVIPGPFLSFMALIILSFARNWEPFSTGFLILMAVLTVFVSILDYVMPALGAKKYGASKWGVRSAVIGMVIGVFFFPPWGMIVGTLIGAMAGEVAAGKKGKEPLRAAWGVFVGSMMGIGVKLAFCGAVLFFYVRGMF